MKLVVDLKRFILKDEEINENEILEKEGLIYIPVKRRKCTVIYKTKMLVASDKEPTNIPTIFLKQWKKRAELNFRKFLGIASEIQFQQKMINLVKEGLIVKVIEYKSRGIEIKNEYFIPSVTLQGLWVEKDKEKLEKDTWVNNKYKEKVKKLKNYYSHLGFEVLRERILEELGNYSKVNKRTDFFTAVLIAASRSPFYDWKEIGIYSIGNVDEKLKTKIFDNQKSEYLEELRVLLGSEVEEIGLTTISGEYFIEFCARCRIQFSFGSFDYQKTVFRSNLTDEEVFDIKFIDKRDIKKMYLFENRAILRKLIKHTSEGIRKNIVMVSFDGQVRSSQYYLCKKWLESGVQELVVWTDFDEYALSMIQKLHTLGFEKFQSVILKDNKLAVAGFFEAEKYLEDFKGTQNVIEQEYSLK